MIDDQIKKLNIFLFYVLLFVSFFMSGNNYLSIIIFQSIFFTSISLSYKDELIKFFNIKNKINIIGLILIICTLTISYFFSPIRQISGLHNSFNGMLIRFLATLSHILFFISFLIFVKKNILDFSLFLKFLIHIFFFYTFLWLIQLQFDLRFIGIDLFDGDIRHVGYLFTFFIATFMAQYAWIILKRKNLKEEFIIKALLLIGLSLFFTYIGGRGAFLSLIICLIILVTLIRKHNSSLVRVFLSNILIIGFLSVFLSVAITKLNLIYDLELKNTGQYEVLKSKLTNSQNFSTGRIYIWNKVLQNNTNPIFGMGPNSYLHIKDNDRKLTEIGAIQPHNIFLQLYLEWGLTGTLLIFVFLLMKFKTLRINCFNKKYNQINIISISACAGLLFHSLFDGTLFYSQTVLLFIIFIILGSYKNNLNTIPHANK